MRLSTCVTHYLRMLLALALCLLSGGCRVMREVHRCAPETVLQPNLLRNAQVRENTQGWELRPQSLPAGMGARRDETGALLLDLSPAAEPVTAAWTQAVALEGGQSYSVSCRVRTRRLEGAANLRLEFYDGRGRLLGQACGAPVWGDSDWVSNSWRGRAPEGTARVVLALGLEGARSGQALFSEPYLSLDDAPLTRALIVDYREVTAEGPGRTGESASMAVPGALQSPAGELPLPAACYGPLDLAAVFPDTAASPYDPAAYRFAQADAALSGAGAQALVRLRLGAEGNEDLWAAVACAVVMHYNAGWAGGASAGFRYWQIEAPGGVAEAGERVASVLQALKAYDPGLQVGVGADPPAMASLLSALAERGLRPDLAAWFVDSAAAPAALATAQERCEQMLERYGMGETAVIALLPPEDRAQDGAPAAARLAVAAGSRQEGRLGRWLPQNEGAAGRETRELLSRLALTSRRLAVQGGDALGFTLAAGKSDDGRRVHILIADSGSRSQAYRLALAGFPPGYRYTIREVSPGQPWRVLQQGTAEDLEGGLLTSPWRAPAVQWIELQW